ncbi:hypothetical protein [Thalassococcus sp. S3]|uniref:hypothetical protein n=1 Tax=Thalassococcus sp. S3 TaxID=2017482 RepID=UPI00102489E4|nr:hypothetical protein [Thalassococcus sp. S3]QBF29985.1 hypothetical protein CFI11_01945 [Thalassococcus sp. S3]
MIRYLVPLFLLTANVALAQDWALRDTDIVLTRGEVEDLTAGQTLVFYDDGQSKFSVGGAYSYTYANGGGTAYGQYDLAEDGTVCIAYRNGFSRCDRYVRSGDRVVMLTEKGERFPIRP